MFNFKIHMCLQMVDKPGISSQMDPIKNNIKNDLCLTIQIVWNHS